MNLVPLTTSLFFIAGFALIVLQDYARANRPLTLGAPRRVLRARAHFRPLPRSIPVEPRGVEIRPVAMRLHPEAHRLAA